jgi:hypothetical protein
MSMQKHRNQGLASETMNTIELAESFADDDLVIKSTGKITQFHGSTPMDANKQHSVSLTGVKFFSASKSRD